MAVPTGTAVTAGALPSGFTESVVFSGLTNPTNIEFAADGRVFVAEKSGIIKVYDNLADTTPTSFTDLTTNVQNYWDRGLLGLALDPSLTNPALPLRPWVYVLYTYDHVLGSSTSAPRWGDGCPNPPGATTDGCVVSGRVSRFTVSGTTISGPEQVLVEDWCEQFPSHSIGSLGFGPDGALYVSGGDGASFNGVDYGQLGGTLGPTTVKNPCGDPPNDDMTPPTAEGGALRAQDIRTDPVPTGTTYAASVLQDGAVGYWRLGEASGTTANDAAGTNNGTYSGAYNLNQTGALSGDTNTAVRLGASAYISVPYGSALQLGNGPLSIEFWLKPTTTGGSEQKILDVGGSGAYQVVFSGPSLDNKIHFSKAGVAEIAASTIAVPDTNWHYVVATKSGAASRIYIDGVDVTGAVSDQTLGNATGPLVLGANRSLGSDFFNGSIDEVALYHAVLTPAQIQAHYGAATTQSSVDPATLDGAILRIDPITGAAFAGNPFASSPDPNKQRIIAYGLRNPFRFELRPGTNELWLGDVGWNDWEEIDRIANIGDATAENFGWPCYEGAGRMAGYDSANLNLCENLYLAGPNAITAPVYTYAHTGNVVPGETCPTGGSAIAGMTFYPESGGTFPVAYRGGLFFADHNRSCIWWMAKGSNGQPDPATRAVFLAPAANPVDLEVGLDGALYYVDFDGSTIRRISFASGNQPPNAIAQANPTNGPAPLTVNFSGLQSTDPENGALAYAWDLDGDGAYDDSTSPTPTFTYPSPATITVGLRVTDPGTLTDTDTIVISAGNSPPVPTITTPTTGTTWQVGQQISFSGSATDAQDGTVPASRLSWQLLIAHCPSTCHTHDAGAFPGVASGTFFAPDHVYPSWLDLTLTATDSNGLSASVTRRLDPITVNLLFQTVPSGLQCVINGVTVTTPFNQTAIKGSANSISATSPQTLGGTTYSYQTWSDGGAATHNVVANAAATYTATYAATGSSITLTPTADAEVRSNKSSKNFGALTTLGVKSNPVSRSYLKFSVPSLSGTIQSAKLRVFVTDPGPAAGSAYLVGNAWTETGVTYTNAPSLPGSPLATAGVATVGTWVEFTVTPAVVSATTVSFALSGGSSDLVEYASRTGSSPPQLVIVTGP